MKKRGDGEVVPRKGFMFVRRAFLAMLNGSFAARVGRWLLRHPLVSRLTGRMTRRLPPPNPRKVVFASFSGSIDCNPKYIARQLMTRHPGLDVVWVLGPVPYRRLGNALPCGVRAVCLGTLSALREIATAGVLIENAQVFVGAGMPDKRKGQFYLNTWHGSLGIKRLNSAAPRIREFARRAEGAVDVLLSNSKFEDEVFASSLFPRTPLARIGHPRNDIFFWPEGERKALATRVREQIGVRAGERIAIYAPTFRHGGFYVGATRFDFERWRQAFECRFGGAWRMAVRLHPHDSKALADGVFSLPKSVIDVSDYPDMQELLITVDAGVTDYSSWIFDYLLGDGIGFVFAPDKAAYDQSRGFYYPLEETPFPVAETESSLCENIRRFDAAKYAADRERFLAARGCMEDGHAAERAVELIERHWKGSVR